jgi:hypothetical protein
VTATSFLKRILLHGIIFLVKPQQKKCVLGILVVGVRIILKWKRTLFWDITPCNLLEVNRRFGGTYRLHLQNRISRARYQRESM